MIADSPPAAFTQPIYVTRPNLPPLESYVESLKEIWTSGILTNGGSMHDALERQLRTYLDVPHLSLVSSGTMALLLALRALNLTGEVITTPFTFAATVNALLWCGLKPVFADIDPETMTLSPAAVERAITPRTTAILGVHVFGISCDVAALQSIAARHDLRIVYDAAHAFGTRVGSRSVASFGDASALSFHATKVFHTAEGGAVVTNDPVLRDRVVRLRNFGIENDASVTLPGLNGKMSELHAALGLGTLALAQGRRRRHTQIGAVYRRRLADLPGVRCVTSQNDDGDTSFFVLRVDPGRGPLSRDGLQQGLERFNVFARRYFSLLCSDYPYVGSSPPSRGDDLAAARKVAAEVLCLPLYEELGEDGADRISDMIHYLANARTHAAATSESS
jgi:dTDP-4-amino-4,6-dideoxygalactose transaminase